MILNDRDNTLHAFVHSRLESLRDTLGWTHSPLNSPQDVPTTHFHTHWFAHNMKSSDTQGFFQREGNRYHDTPIHTALGHTTYAPIKHHLTSRGIYWTSQITTHTGRTLLNPRALGINSNTSTWWDIIHTSCCIPGTNTLRQPVFPITPPIPTIRSTFRPDTVVTIPTMTQPDVFLSPRKNRFFAVLSFKIDEDGFSK
jgi:hypothetical protein